MTDEPNSRAMYIFKNIFIYYVVIYVQIINYAVEFNAIYKQFKPIILVYYYYYE